MCACVWRWNGWWWNLRLLGHKSDDLIISLPGDNYRWSSNILIFLCFFVNTEIILNSFWRSLMGVTTFAPQCNFSSVWRPWNQNRVTLKHIVAESCCHLSACDVCDKPWYQDTGSCSRWWQLTTFVVYRVQCITCPVLNVGCTYLLVLYVLSCSTSMKIPVCWYFFDVTQLILALLTSSMFFVALCCWVILLIDFLSF